MAASMAGVPENCAAFGIDKVGNWIAICCRRLINVGAVAAELYSGGIFEFATFLGIAGVARVRGVINFAFSRRWCVKERRGFGGS